MTRIHLHIDGAKDLFDWQTLALSAGIRATFGPPYAEIFSLLHRFFRGEWGEDCPEDDAQANDQLVKAGAGRLYAHYQTTQGPVWIICNIGQDCNVLLPAEW